MFVGVDPAIGNTGIVALDAAGRLLGGYNSKFRPGKRPKKTPFQNLLRYEEIAEFAADSLAGCLAQTGASGCVICYEDYSYESENKAFSIGELGGVLKSRLLAVGGLVLVEPTRLKKFATGRGNTKGKTPIITRAEAESQSLRALPAPQKTSDVCDAYFLAKLAWYLADPEAAAVHDKDHPLLRERLSLAKTLHKEMPDGELQYFGNLKIWKRNGRSRPPGRNHRHGGPPGPGR